MDAVLEKFSVFDFFNIVFSGIVFLTCLYFCIGDTAVYSSCISYLFAVEEDVSNAMSTLVFAFRYLCVCYLIGSVLQAVNSAVENTYHIRLKAKQNCLNDNSVIENGLKREIYKEHSRKLLQEKGIDLENYSEEEIGEYFFAHCEYCNQVNMNSAKAEKMRDVRGLSGLLMSCFLVLTICSLLVLIISLFIPEENDFLLRIVASTLVYGAFTAIFYYRMRKDTLYRIRMVLGVYEASMGGNGLPV